MAPAQTPQAPNPGPKYIGLVFPIPVARGGLVGVRDQGAIDPDKLIVARNVSLFGLTIQKEGGAIKYNASAITGAPIILGGWDWWPSAGLQRCIVIGSDGKMYRDTGAGTFGTTLKSSLSMTSVVPVFVEGGAESSGLNRKLFCFTGLNAVQVLSGDGTTTTDLGGVAAPGAPTAALAGLGAGNINNGTHSWKITFVVGGGETTGGTTSNQVNVVDKTVNGQVALSAIPLGPSGTTSRKVYRTIAGDTGSYLLVGTIADNTTTIYTDNVADGSLGAAAPGSNTATTKPADWSGSNQPSFGLLHEGRMFGGGNANDPHRVYYSEPTNHEVYTGLNAGTLSIYPGEGEKLVGGISYKGLLILFKYPHGIYLVDTSSPTTANWRISRLTRGVGGVSPLGAAMIDDDVVFVDASCNFHLLSRVQASDNAGSISESNLARQQHIYSFLQDNINLSRMGAARLVYYSQKRELHCAMTGTGATTNTVRFVIDYNVTDPNTQLGYKESTEYVRFRFSDRDTCESLWLRKDANTTPRLTSGDDLGFVWLMDQSLKSKDGLGYSSLFQTPYMDFSWLDPKFGTVRKIGQFLELIVSPTGNWNLSVDVLWDGQYVHTTQFNMGISGSTFGSFTLGTDRLAGDQIVNRKRRILGSGRRISLVSYNNIAGQDFAIGHFLIHALVADERPGRGQ